MSNGRRLRPDTHTHTHTHPVTQQHTRTHRHTHRPDTRRHVEAQHHALPALPAHARGGTHSATRQHAHSCARARAQDAPSTHTLCVPRRAHGLLCTRIEAKAVAAAPAGCVCLLCVSGWCSSSGGSGRACDPCAASACGDDNRSRQWSFNRSRAAR